MSLKQQQWGYFNDENGELDKHEWWFTSKLRIEGKSCKNNTCNTNRIWFWMSSARIGFLLLWTLPWFHAVLTGADYGDERHSWVWKPPKNNVLLKGIFDFWQVEYQIVMVESWLKPKSWCFWGNAGMILVLAACRLLHAVYKRRCVRNICSYDQKEKTSCSRRLPSCKRTYMRHMWGKPAITARTSGAIGRWNMPLSLSHPSWSRGSFGGPDASRLTMNEQLMCQKLCQKSMWMSLKIGYTIWYMIYNIYIYDNIYIYTYTWLPHVAPKWHQFTRNILKF